jgi:DNA-binding transcriptional MerR regulator
MSTSDEHWYLISQASEETGVAVHLLRQWETKFPQLNPKRNRAGRRFYNDADLDIVKRINYLLRHEKLTIPGARKRLAQELLGEGRPQSNQEAVDLLDKMQDEIRAMVDLLDSV